MSNSPSSISLLQRVRRSVGSFCLLGMLAALTGCSHLRSMAPKEYAYVTVKQTYLRDRVAVVANRVAQVTNGERLQVLEHGRRFLRVKTPDGAMGWVEDHAVIDQTEYDLFQDLAKHHAAEPAVATAELYNELYVHLTPGRKTQRFYLLPVNTKVSLLERASVARGATPGVLGLPLASATHAVAAQQSADAHNMGHRENLHAQSSSAVPMEDWWLVRATDGRTGWMLSHDLEVDVPQDVAQYAENEKMIGAYVLRMVDDPDSGKPDGKMPEYLTVLTTYKQGLPYDFDQVRVFTWDKQHHRYGTAFRLPDIAGFFPVKVTPGDANAPNGPVPIFSVLVAPGGTVRLDPATGKANAGQLETMTFHMEGNLVRRVLAPGETAAASAKRPVTRHHAAHVLTRGHKRR
jgi:hypothetical protein